MAPPRAPDPRMPVSQKQFAQEVAERKQNEARLRKQNHALSVFNLINVDVEKKATSLRLAATRIGTAYSVAAGRHKEALSKMEQIKAMETQLMFSVLTVLTSGASPGRQHWSDCRGRRKRLAEWRVSWPSRPCVLRCPSSTKVRWSHCLSA